MSRAGVDGVLEGSTAVTSIHILSARGRSQGIECFMIIANSIGCPADSCEVSATAQYGKRYKLRHIGNPPSAAPTFCFPAHPKLHSPATSPATSNQQASQKPISPLATAQ